MVMRALKVGRFSYILVLTVAIAAPSGAFAAGWKVVLDDEFTASTLDRSTWATRYIYSNETLDHLNHEAEHYRDNDNHVMKDGALHLTARQTPDGWESGMIRSQQTFYYGYFEARVRLPKGRGIWPAFWLNSDYNIDGKLAWPPEIDVFEYVVNGRQDTENMFHSAGSNYPAGAKLDYSYHDPLYSLHLRDYVSDTPLNQDWHVFALLWLPTEYTVFMDGKKIYTRAFQWLNKSGAMAPPAHVLLNFAVGGSWAGRYGIDETNFPQSFDVDYVRVCQFSESGGATDGCPHDPRGPDLKSIRYQAAGDMKKPKIVDASLVRPTSRAARDAKNVPGTKIQVRAEVADLSSAGNDRSLFVGMRDLNSKTIVASTYTAIPQDSSNSNALQTLNAYLAIPSQLIPGRYDLVVGLSAQVAAIDLKAGKEQLTPISCEVKKDERPKALLCVIDQIEIGQ